MSEQVTLDLKLVVVVVLLATAIAEAYSLHSSKQGKF